MRAFLHFSTGEPRVLKAVEGVSLAQILELGHSPVYVTSLSAIRSRAEAYLKALSRSFSSSGIYYAMKANFAPPVLREVYSAGGGIDIVSIGEWRAARAAGVPGSAICFAGVGKAKQEWQEAIAGGLGCINVEQSEELTDVLSYLTQTKAQTLVAVRLNPCVELETHPHLKTGALDSKFGLLFEQIQEWVEKTKKAVPNLEERAIFTAPLRGLHVHIGSQLLKGEVFTHVIEKVLSCAQYLYSEGIPLNHLDLGGGLGVGFKGTPSDNSDIASHVEMLASALKKAITSFPDLQALWGPGLEKLHVCLEPGRSVVASSTVFLTKVLYEKSNSPDIHFGYVDGAMNDFPRPSLYGARHEVVFAHSADLRGRASKSYRIVGPVCESGDVLAQDAVLPKLEEGDIIAFMEAGAYCRSMASHYNLRALPAEVFVKDQKIVEVRPAVLPQF